MNEAWDGRFLYGSAYPAILRKGAGTSSVEQSAEQILTQGGIFGAVFLLVTVPLAYFVLRLTRELGRVQEERTNDAKQARDVLLELIREFNTTLAGLTATFGELRRDMQALAQIIERVDEELRRRRDEYEPPRRPRG